MKTQNKLLGLVSGIVGVFAFVLISHAQVGVNASVNANTKANLHGDENVMEENDNDIEAGAGINANINTDVEGRVSGNTSVKEDSKNEAEMEDNSSTSVETKDEAKEESKVEVEKAESDENHVAVAYSERAKILGFLPATVTSRVIVNTDGSIEVSHPWYWFMVSGKDDNEVEGSVKNSVPTVNSSVSTKFSSEAQTNIINRVKAAIMTSFQGDVSMR